MPAYARLKALPWHRAWTMLLRGEIDGHLVGARYVLKLNPDSEVRGR